MSVKGDWSRVKDFKAWDDNYAKAFGKKEEKEEVIEVMNTYDDCVKQVQTYCGMGDPTIVVSYLLKEIRCRDKRLEELQDWYDEHKDCFMDLTERT